MNNIFVYCEIEDGKVADVSLELLTKGRVLADTLGCELEALALGHNLAGIEKELAEYGADRVHVADCECLAPYRTLPHAAVVCGSLEIGSHTDVKSGKEYKDLLYQIRPAFGGNIIATIINPDHRPQMATVREGVMKKEKAKTPGKGIVKKVDPKKYVNDADFVVRIIDRQIEERKINIKGAPVIVAGGYGMGSKENFDLLFELADVLGAEVGASRAAVDAGMAEHGRQVGQTGVTVRPKLYIACGISGQIQHTAGMDQSSMIISINTDPDAPINKIADYAITGDVTEVIPKMIKYYKQNSK